MVNNDTTASIKISFYHKDYYAKNISYLVALCWCIDYRHQ